MALRHYGTRVLQHYDTLAIQNYNTTMAQWHFCTTTLEEQQNQRCYLHLWCRFFLKMNFHVWYLSLNGSVKFSFPTVPTPTVGGCVLAPQPKPDSVMERTPHFHHFPFLCLSQNILLSTFLSCDITSWLSGGSFPHNLCGFVPLSSLACAVKSFWHE